VIKHHHLISAKTFRKILVGLAILLFLFAGFGLASIIFPGLTQNIMEPALNSSSTGGWGGNLS
jgi:hypothetical protein